MGYWRLMDWGFTTHQLIAFIEQGLDLGITTVDHADIYGGYRVEGCFGEALAQVPGLRERLEIVTKCGIVLERQVWFHILQAAAGAEVP
jgi:predicted oxidoreductase